MSKTTQALRDALRELVCRVEVEASYRGWGEWGAMTSARAALAQADAQAQGAALDAMAENARELGLDYVVEAQGAAEPAAVDSLLDEWADAAGLIWHHGETLRPVLRSDARQLVIAARHTAAPQQVEPPPLTDEQIMELTREHCESFRWPSSAIECARAVEQAVRKP
jgi:hypothetical protein